MRRADAACWYCISPLLGTRICLLMHGERCGCLAVCHMPLTCPTRLTSDAARWIGIPADGKRPHRVRQSSNQQQAQQQQGQQQEQAQHLPAEHHQPHAAEQQAAGQS